MECMLCGPEIDTARVIVTTKCDMNCKGCANTKDLYRRAKIIEDLKDLSGFEKVVITGGEPGKVRSEALSYYTMKLREKTPNIKIYLQTAYIVSFESLSNFDGVTFTIHYPGKYYTRRYINLLMNLERIKTDNPDFNVRIDCDSRRTDVDVTAYMQYIDRFRLIKWRPKGNCAISFNEELFITRGAYNEVFPPDPLFADDTPRERRDTLFDAPTPRASRGVTLGDIIGTPSTSLQGSTFEELQAEYRGLTEAFSVPVGSATIESTSGDPRGTGMG